MTRDEVLARMQVIYDDLFLEEVRLTPELSGTEVEEWDSLMQITIVAAVEEAFGIRFQTGEVQVTRNVGEFAGLVIFVAGGRRPAGA